MCDIEYSPQKKVYFSILTRFLCFLMHQVRVGLVHVQIFIIPVVEHSIEQGVCASAMHRLNFTLA